MTALKSELDSLTDGLSDEAMKLVIGMVRQLVLPLDHKVHRVQQNITDTSDRKLKKMEAFHRLAASAGGFSEDFDPERELEEARKEKYGMFTQSEVKAITPEEFCAIMSEREIK